MGSRAKALGCCYGLVNHGLGTGHGLARFIKSRC